MSNDKLIFRNTERSYDNATPSGGVDNEKYFPTVSFNAGELPEIVSWVPGGEYKIVLKVKQKDVRILEEDGSIEEDANFEIVGVAAISPMFEDLGKKAEEKLNK